MPDQHRFIRQDLLELATAYAEYSVLVTTAELESPGPQILYANSAFTRMTGYAVSELLGKTPRILQGPKTDRVLLGRLRSTLESGKDFIARTVNYKQDGTPFELEWVISHLRDSEDRTTHYIAVQRDITGLQRAESELDKFDSELRGASVKLVETFQKLEVAEQKLAAREQLAALGEMTAGVVHDIGNALTPVFGLIQCLHSMDSIPAEIQAVAANLDASVEHAIQILSNLKRYHRHGHMQLNEPVDLSALIHQLPDLTRSRWWTPSRKNTGSINYALDVKSPAIVEGNSVELLQVLVNLAINAIDAMPEGGTVGVTLITDDTDAVISISDSGAGMSAEMLENCFIPYVTYRSSGTGLGLSVCRRIVEQHNGSIIAKPANPHGVIMTVRIPLHGSTDDSQQNSKRTTQEALRVLHTPIFGRSHSTRCDNHSSVTGSTRSRPPRQPKARNAVQAITAM